MNQEKASKLLDKLVNSPIGRQVVGNKLNLQFATESDHDPNKAIVAILVPCYESPRPEMANALALMMEETKRSGVALCYTGPVIRDSSVVHWSRNMLIAELIKTQKPWTHVLFIDDDIVPKPDALVKLLSHNMDIVAGVCTTRNDPPIPNIRWWDEEALNFRTIFDWPKDKLIEVGGVGTGMMLITRNGLQQVAQAYFDCLYEKEMYGLTDEAAKKITVERLKYFDQHANASWFRFLGQLNGSNEYGEDMCFCLVAKRYCGITVYCDTSVQPDHIGRYGFGVKDYEALRDEAIAKAKREGRYKEPAKIKVVERDEIEVVA